MALLTEGFAFDRPIQDFLPNKRFLRLIVSKSLIAALCLSSILVAQPLCGQSKVPKEYQLKAAFLYNFAKFVQWPTKSFSDTTSPLVIGVLGQNPFGNELEKAVQGRTANGRAIIVKQIQKVDAAHAVQLLFVPATDDSRLTELKEICQTQGILVIGESAGFIKRGGMVAFKVEGDNLRFEVNTSAAAGAELKFSAQLLKLASNIR